MKKILNYGFTIALVIFVILGMVSVVAQAFCVIIGNGALSDEISNTIQIYAIAISGICAVISFVYLMFSKEAFKEVEED